MRTVGMVTAMVLAGFVAAGTTPVFAQDTVGVGTIRGVVTDPQGAATRDVILCATATSQCVTSSAEGRFSLTVRPGVYRLEVVAPGQPLFVTDEIQVRAGLDQTIDVRLPQSSGVQESVTVAAPAFTAPEEVKTSGFLVGSESIVTSAGALEDVARYVQTLPGVVIGSNDFRNDLIVRGGSPLENLYIVDNIEIPNINTFATFASAGGTVSILDARLIDNVTFLTGGYPAPYGNRTSAVLQIAQREGRRDRRSAFATVGFAGAGGVVEGPIGRAAKGSWILSVRRSFLDLFTEDIGIGGVPVLYTLNAKAVYDLSPRDRVWMVNVSGVDRIRLGLTETTDPSSELNNFDIRYRGGRAATGVNWQRVFGSRGVGLLGVTHARAYVNQQVKDLVRGGVPLPGTPVADQIAGGALIYRENSTEAETTVKYDLTLDVPVVQKVQVGGSVRRIALDYASASPFGSDSPFFPEPDRNPFVLDERFSTSQVSAYAQATRRMGSRASVTGGLRVDRYGIAAATRVSPRIGADLTLSPRLSLRASAGQYYQQPFLQFMAAFPANRALKPFRADHFVVGLNAEVDAATRITAEVYRKNYRDYPVSSQIPSLSLANVGDTFEVLNVLFPATSGGRGDATGVEVNLEARETAGRRWSLEANVALSRARYSGTDGVLRPGSFDYPVVVNLDGGYRVGDRWSVSARMAYLDGRPYTPVDLERSTAQRRAVYDLSRVNAERLPDYFRLDLRIDRRFGSAARPFTLFGGVQNVTNRQNVAGYDWDRRKNVERVQDQLGIFPILGLEWQF